MGVRKEDPHKHHEDGRGGRRAAHIIHDMADHRFVCDPGAKHNRHVGYDHEYHCQAAYMIESDYTGRSAFIHMASINEVRRRHFSCSASLPLSEIFDRRQHSFVISLSAETWPSEEVGCPFSCHCASDRNILPVSAGCRANAHFPAKNNLP